MSDELAAVAITWARPGCEEQIRLALEALGPPVWAEAGMLQYDLHRDVNDPRCFVYVERWENEATFAAHCVAPHVAVYLEKTKDWIERSHVHVIRKML